MAFFRLVDNEAKTDETEKRGGEITTKTPAPRNNNFNREESRENHNTLNWGKIGRNALCPRGSGKKFKHCHGRAH